MFAFKKHIFTLLILLMPCLGFAQARTALVIGNGLYDVAPLKNPLNDAQDVAAALRVLDFEVLEYLNADRKDMRRAIREFGDKLKAKGGVGLFYFAGHGMQVDGKNFLLPLDAGVESQEDLLDEGVNAGYVLDQMKQAGNDLNIVMLDACRNNPFESQFRSATRGLSRMQGPTGSLIAFATSPGDVADDGEGRNGTYTKFFLDYVMEPGLTLEQVFKNVRRSVEEHTNGDQIPWESSSLKGDFFFVNQPTESEKVTLSEEQAMWDAVKDSDHVEDLEEFIDAYPASMYLLAAKFKIEKINRSKNQAPVFGRVKSSEERINAIMLDAQSLMIGNTISPKSLGQAFFLYEEAHALMPEHPRVEMLKRNIVDAYVALSQQAWERKDYLLSRNLVDSGLGLAPKEKRLLQVARLLDKQDRKRDLALPGF